jgi:hypothetical protein
VCWCVSATNCQDDPVVRTSTVAIRTDIDACKCAHTHTHTYIHTHIRTHIHIHIHTHTLSIYLSIYLSVSHTHSQRETYRGLHAFLGGEIVLREIRREEGQVLSRRVLPQLLQCWCQWPVPPHTHTHAHSTHTYIHTYIYTHTYMSNNHSQLCIRLDTRV